ncbi:MAG: hypothetical protein H0X17_10425 [Deltaproteobacteria bacterium]|nr:hypothetical protein [Deltaproteobacteria bacterium]
MRTFLIAALALSLFSGVAAADRGGHRGRGHHKGPVVRDHRGSPPQRANRPARRADRRAVDRQTVRATNGRFVFANGTTRVYRRPVIRTHYYNASVRPRVIVESYRSEPGYIWVRGGWTWVGSEWQWGGGYYAPDPQYQTYYDDGSYDYSPSLRVGVGISIGG